MDTDTILRKLSEWKERILFCAVLLCVLYVARNATLTGAGIDTIDRETRQAAIGASGVDEQTACARWNACRSLPISRPRRLTRHR